MFPAKRFSRTLPIMMIIIMVGFFLRIFHLTTVPLRGDEAFSVQYWAGQPLNISLAKTATIEPHPLLTYAIFRGWGLIAGTSELAMRILPALIGLLGIPAIYAVGKRLANRQLGLLAALIFAIHPFEIWHAQDARNYAIWAGMSLVALWLGLRLLDKQRKQDWLLYTVAASLAANIFYTELLTVAAFGLFVLIAYWGKWKAMFAWASAAAIATALSLGSFIIFQMPLFARGGYTGTIGTTLDTSQMWTHFLPALSFGEITLPPETLTSLWPLVAIMLIAGLIILWDNNRRRALALTLLALLPLLLLTVISTRLNIFTPRYVLSTVPAFILIFANLLIYIAQQLPRKVTTLIAIILLGGWLFVSGTSLRNYYFDPAYAKARNWPALAHYLQQNTQPNDLVIQSAADSAFGYYYHQVQAAEAPDIALPETPAQPTTDIESKLASYSQQKNTIWQVGQEFPDWPNVGTVRTWLDNHMQIILSGQAGELPYRVYKNWQVASEEISNKTDAAFENAAKLIGYQIIYPPQNDENLTVWLYWKPLTTTASPLKVFVHLLGPVNPATGFPLWSQDDRFPQNGRISTQTWSPDDIYRDIYTLPLKNVPAGSYTLEVGFYNPDTNTRLKVDDSDSYILQSIELK
jgi:4-amino-4-deoxy-L-arabinose transferase-like glycosyltransferase